MGAGLLTLNLLLAGNGPLRRYDYIVRSAKQQREKQREKQRKKNERDRRAATASAVFSASRTHAICFQIHNTSNVNISSV